MPAAGRSHFSAWTTRYGQAPMPARARPSPRQRSAVRAARWRIAPTSQPRAGLSRRKGSHNRRPGSSSHSQWCRRGPAALVAAPGSRTKTAPALALHSCRNTGRKAGCTEQRRARFRATSAGLTSDTGKLRRDRSAQRHGRRTGHGSAVFPDQLAYVRLAQSTAISARPRILTSFSGGSRQMTIKGGYGWSGLL